MYGLGNRRDKRGAFGYFACNGEEKEGKRVGILNWEMGGGASLSDIILSSHNQFHF